MRGLFKSGVVLLSLSVVTPALLAKTALAETSRVVPAPEKIETYVAGEVLVQWKENYFGIQSQDVQPISVMSVTDVSTALQALRQDPRVDHVEPNYTRHLALAPDDIQYPAQLYLEQLTDLDIDAEAAWDAGTGSREIVVAVIDSGVDIDHPDLTDNIWTNPNEIASNGLDDDNNGYVDDVHGWDFISNDNDPNPTPIASGCDSTCQIYVLHGTHVAGILGATGNNAAGVTGVNWQVSIMPLRIFDTDGASTTSAELEAIAYAQTNGATVINMSYGGYTYSLLEDEALTAAYDNGIVNVAAAGNDARNLNLTPAYPACNDNVLGVGAVDVTDVTASFSNYGNDCVDLAAPGVDIYSTYYTNDSAHSFITDYGYLSGTSMATPVVSGVAALLWAADATLTANEVTDAILSTTDPISDTTLGSGRINAATAMHVAVTQGPDPVTISAYASAQSNLTIAADERSNDATPYFTWDEPVSMMAVSGYYVYLGTKTVDPVTAGTLQTATNFTPTVHGNNSTYHLRIKAVDVLGQTSALTDFSYVIDTKVDRPMWRTAAQTKDGSYLRWHRPKGEHVIGYYIYRSRQRSGHFEKISSHLVTKTSYVDKKVQPGKQYYYKLRAVDDLGNQSVLTAAKRAK